MDAMEKECLTKAHHAAEFLAADLREAHSKTKSIATEILLFDMIGEVERTTQRLHRLAEAEGQNEFDQRGDVVGSVIQEPQGVTIGQRLRSAREAAGLTRFQAAAAMKTHISSIANHEGDVNRPKPHILERYARCYGVTAESIDKEIHHGQG
jgi:hypothetical protein